MKQSYLLAHQMQKWPSTCSNSSVICFGSSCRWNHIMYFVWNRHDCFFNAFAAKYWAFVPYESKDKSMELYFKLPLISFLQYWIHGKTSHHWRISTLSHACCGGFRSNLFGITRITALFTFYIPCGGRGLNFNPWGKHSPNPWGKHSDKPPPSMSQKVNKGRLVEVCGQDAQQLLKTAYYSVLGSTCGTGKFTGICNPFDISNK